MAMISCSECKKEISDSATVCPHCGKKNYFELPWAVRIIGGIIGLIILFAGLYHAGVFR